MHRYSSAVRAIWPSAGKNSSFCSGARFVCYLPNSSRFSYLLFIHYQKVVVSEYFPFPGVSGKMIVPCLLLLCMHIYLCVYITYPSKYQHTTVGLIQIPFGILNMLKL